MRMGLSGELIKASCLDHGVPMILGPTPAVRRSAEPARRRTAPAVLDTRIQVRGVETHTADTWHGLKSNFELRIGPGVLTAYCQVRN